MSESIYQNNYDNAVRECESCGYRKVSGPQAERVEYEGRVWSREATFAKDIKGWDRFVLFMRTLFEKIALALKFKFLSSETRDYKRLNVLEDNWEFAWNGTTEIKVYSDVLLKMQAKVFDLIYPADSAALPQECVERLAKRNKTLSDESSIKIIPAVNSFAVRISQELEGAEDLFGNKLNELNIPFVQQDYSNGLKQFVIDNNHMSQFLSALGNFQALIAQDAQAQELYTSLGAINQLKTLNLSLSSLIPNEGFTRIIPYTAIHPNGDLSIRFPGSVSIPLFSFENSSISSSCFAERLKQYLEASDGSRSIDFTLYPIDFTDGWLNYNQEMRIKKESLGQFLQLLHLSQDAAGIDFLSKLVPCEASQRYHPSYIAHSTGGIDFLQTIGNSLLSHALPEDGLPLPQVNISPDGLEIKVPQALQNQLIEIAPGKQLNFGHYLAHTYCLKGQSLQDNEYCLLVPKDAIKSFLERDLQLRAIPASHLRAGQVAFYPEFVKAYGDRLGLQNQPCDAIKGWSMRNPTINLPTDIPSLSVDQIVGEARQVLRGHPQVARYCQIIEETLNRRDELGYEQQELLIKYLSLMVLPPRADLGITRERQRAALETIGASATRCLEGRFTKIQVEFNGMLHPASRDLLKTEILHKIEEFKMGVLADIFRGPGDYGAFEVHNVASAQVAWGEELGLDVEAGRRDGYHNINMVHNEHKRQFITACEEGLVTYVYEQLSQARVENEGFSTDDLLHALEYRERLVDIFLKEGYTQEEIDGEDYDDVFDLPVGGIMDQFLPLNEEGKMRLTRAALVKIMADMDILKGYTYTQN